MKNHISKITILFAAIIMVLLVSCTSRNSKRYYESHTGKVITVWGNYVIFEKYKGKLPPKDNYIKILNVYADACCFFKSNDSIIIYRPDDNSLEIGFHHNDKIAIYEYENLHEFAKRASFSDPLATLEFSYTPMHDLGMDESWITICECVEDSVYIKRRVLRSLNLSNKEVVYSRYDEILRSPFN